MRNHQVDTATRHFANDLKLTVKVLLIESSATVGKVQSGPVFRIKTNALERVACGVLSQNTQAHGGLVCFMNVQAPTASNKVGVERSSATACCQLLNRNRLTGTIDSRNRAGANCGASEVCEGTPNKRLPKANVASCADVWSQRACTS